MVTKYEILKGFVVLLPRESDLFRTLTIVDFLNGQPIHRISGSDWRLMFCQIREVETYYHRKQLHLLFNRRNIPMPYQTDHEYNIPLTTTEFKYGSLQLNLFKKKDELEFRLGFVIRWEKYGVYGFLLDFQINEAGPVWDFMSNHVEEIADNSIYNHENYYGRSEYE